MAKETDNQPILLFDGLCNLCSSAVTFIIPRDKKGLFRFASLQSQSAQTLLQKWKLPTDQFDSLVFVHGDELYTKSTAALKVVKHFKGLWPMLYIFIIIPRPIRDSVYDLFARNRYRWFGKKDQCMIPSPDIKKRFLE